MLKRCGRTSEHLTIITELIPLTPVSCRNAVFPTSLTSRLVLTLACIAIVTGSPGGSKQGPVSWQTRDYDRDRGLQDVVNCGFTYYPPSIARSEPESIHNDDDHAG